MYFEFSAQKLNPLGFATSLLVLGVACFMYADATWAVMNRTAEFVYRVESNIAYTFFYKYTGASQLAAAAVGRRGTSTHASSTYAQAIPVLIYHGTPPEGVHTPPLPQSLFVEQLRALKADGWQTITLKQFKDFMEYGTPVPEKSFLLTFDDARKESFYPADPVLKDLGYTAVMYVITGFSLPDRSNKASTFYLNRTELEYMLQSGRWELESHGAEDHRLYDVPSASTEGGERATLPDEHFLSNKFWLSDQGRIETDEEYRARVAHDLKHAKEVLERTFGKPVTTFAYPFSDYGQQSKNFPDAVAALSNVVSDIYEYSFYQVDHTRNDIFNYPDSDAYMIKRIEPTASWSGSYLVHLLNANAPKSLPYTSTTSWDAWNANWGSARAEGSVLALRATEITTGATALLNGSAPWRDYHIEAEIDWKSGSAVSLLARYQSDSKTSLSCAFTKDRIMLKGREKGVQTTIASASYSFAGDTQHAQFAMEVAGNTAVCSAYGAEVRAPVDDSYLHTGSVAIQIWDEAEGTAAVDVRRVSVMPAYE